MNEEEMDLPEEAQEDVANNNDPNNNAGNNHPDQEAHQDEPEDVPQQNQASLTALFQRLVVFSRCFRLFWLTKLTIVGRKLS